MDIKNYKPGQVVSVPGFVQQARYSLTPTWHTTELSGHGYVVICPFPLTFTVPSTFNVVAAQIAAIDKALVQAADSYHQTVASLKEQKRELLQVTYEDGEVLEAASDDAAVLSLIDAAEPAYGEAPDDIPF